MQENSINIKTKIKAINQKGFMAYEYNPLHNYRITETVIDNTNLSNSKIAGQLTDLDTEELQFDLNHPVDMEIQPSYDGSVNIIMNDGKNQPRLINSRFSKRELNTYEVVDRVGDNDTNIYDQGQQFNQDISLYKKINTIPKIKFNEIISVGSLKVGNYVLYFKLEDADGNETDFIGESGIISIFKGNNKDPFSIDGGIADMLAYKSISVTVENIDTAYDYLKVYVVRTSATQGASRFTEVFKINKKYIVRNKKCNIIITGEEQKETLSINDINTQYFIASSAKTQAQCQSMLFLGNVAKPTVPFNELTNYSLTFQPYIKRYNKNKLIGNINLDTYTDDSNIIENYEYYNVHNIYYHVGYWNEEIYRLGVVYIFNDGTTSQVFNILGNSQVQVVESPTQYKSDLHLNKCTYTDDSGQLHLKSFEIDEENFTINNQSRNLNSKGVIRINDTDQTDYEPIYSIGIAINKKILNLFKDKIKGFFFVRQKRIPTILAQGITMPRDLESNLPVIKFGKQYLIESFLDKKSRILSHDFEKHLRNISEDQKWDKRKDSVIICPEFETNQAYYNTLFTGSTYPVIKSNIQYKKNDLNRSSQNTRFFITDNLKLINNTYNIYQTKIVSVTDENPLANIDDIGFKGVVGDGSNYDSYVFAGKDNRKNSKAENLVRGIFSPYLGIVGMYNIPYNTLVNIYISEYSLSKMQDYFKIRYEDGNSYYPISDRFDISKLYNDWEAAGIIIDEDGNRESFWVNNFFRGDCYTCPFTHRLNRNFQSTTAPTNDVIVDEHCWADNYDSEKTDNNSKVNLGDINAIKLGSWITMRVRSTTNLCIRSLDESHINESSIMGNPRGFYPLQQATVEGSYKIANSYIVNDGFRSTTGIKENYTQPDVPYLKNNFENRIIYSEIAVNDAFKNGYRVFNFTNFRDYSREYGSIIKLVELHGNLLCVFEHGVTLIPINEKNLINGSREVFINSNNILPTTGQVLSNMYGSQWSESVIKTPYYIYGVDTIGKKIWRTNGQSFEIISDMKVNKYLVDNISLGERETTPIIGIRNVKTHYNANKSDVLFTFYDNTYGYEEKVWNLCWNEIAQQFITFYSWVPSYSANIDNQFYSFNRNTSKWIAKLSGLDGLSLENPYLIKDQNGKYALKDEKTKILLSNRFIPKNVVPTYEINGLLNRRTLNHYFKVQKIGQDWYLLMNDVPNEVLTDYFSKNKIGYLQIKVNLKEQIQGNEDVQKSSWNEYLEINKGYYEFSVAITTEEIKNNYANTNKAIPSLTTDLWKHGSAGIYDVVDTIKPTNWYGEQHPFEFEFVVTGQQADSQAQKIYNNLIIISNKAEPESFHFDIVGEGYTFSSDKLNMYYRQEATKEFYQLLGSNMLYNRDYTKLIPKRNNKSTIFNLYYKRIDTFDEIYDSYQEQQKSNMDYQNLSGTELFWDKDLNEFRLITHEKNMPFNKIDENGRLIGRLRGNSQYKEDRWDIQIPSIIYQEKNEQKWVGDQYPLIVLGMNDPKDLTLIDFQQQWLPDQYNKYLNIEDTIDQQSWSQRKETKLRDKYIRIRVRYSGKDLAIITAIHTLYTISYA